MKKMPKFKTIDIVAHGDYDGIASAVEALGSVGIEAIPGRIYFAQPFALPPTPMIGSSPIIVVDIAPNNRDINMTRDFIAGLGDRLLGWYDHHQGWDQMGVENNPRFHIDATAPACAAMFGGTNQMVLDAIAADTRKGEMSAEGQYIEAALKANLSNITRRAAFSWLYRGDRESYEDMTGAAAKYPAVLETTKSLVSKYEIQGSVALVDARESIHEYEPTVLLSSGRKLARFAVVLTVEEGLVVTTDDESVNLVNMFGLHSGAPFRITLPIERLGEVMEKLV